ncbi:hypothetical protein EB118_13700 [bacterium]|nr:hypothetical protein [bacterium]NDD83042.1 hypothetical protein [bacterium]NDG31108.1 hypothetical protein [bacterium]
MDVYTVLANLFFSAGIVCQRLVVISVYFTGVSPLLVAISLSSWRGQFFKYIITLLVGIISGSHIIELGLLLMLYVTQKQFPKAIFFCVYEKHRKLDIPKTSPKSKFTFFGSIKVSYYLTSLYNFDLISHDIHRFYQCQRQLVCTLYIAMFITLLKSFDTFHNPLLYSIQVLVVLRIAYIWKQIHAIYN